jgi:hypothetical protein
LISQEEMKQKKIEVLNLDDNNRGDEIGNQLL